MNQNTRLEAAHLGAKHYSGKPCTKCGSNLRYVSSCNCVHCTKDRSTKLRMHVRDLTRAAQQQAQDGQA